MINVIYLYNKHDTDLIGLLEEVGIKNFRGIIKDALRILTRPGYTPKINIPEYKPYSGEKERYQVFISIQSEKDEDVRELLTHVKYRQINSFIKMALRFYLGVVPTLSSMLDMELIKTIPVYTPNGIIVLSSNTYNTKNIKKSKKVDTIKKVNKTIREKEKEILQNKQEEIIVPINQNNENKNNNIEISNTNIVSIETNNEVTNIDDDDVLSLLEGLMD